MCSPSIIDLFCFEDESPKFIIKIIIIFNLKYKKKYQQLLYPRPLCQCLLRALASHKNLLRTFILSIHCETLCCIKNEFSYLRRKYETLVQMETRIIDLENMQ
ncbi:hypothetical protein RIF29_27534 [Crotalaria pallida]|uniref:Uncharacterized protein n=1 Tax=Crotalaria pallida TaxID=3830 RepID=A0AAN9EQ70_CROPI